MDDIGPDTAHDAGELPRGLKIELVTWRQRHELEAFLGSPPQLTVRMGDEHRALAALAKTEDGEKNLVLPTAPRGGRVDVEGKQPRAPAARAPAFDGSRAGAGSGCPCSSSQSFTNLSST